MKIHLAYGKKGIDLDIPEAWNPVMIEPEFVPGLPHPQGSLEAALRQPAGKPPLREWASRGSKIGIVFSDITRPTPNHVILPPILAELSGVPREQITLFNALGTHRENTRQELCAMLGESIVDNYRIVQNDAFDPQKIVKVGTTGREHEIWLNREFMECDLKILTGFIEPHLFAGFSGGGKAVLPGVAGQKTVLQNHNYEMICDPRSTWGILAGNPLYEEIREAAGMAGEIFLVNVALNKHKEITAVFAGDLDAAHMAGCEYVREKAMVAVSEPFDIILTTNSGYPLDLNLYQSVKGMSAAAQIVRRGGAIVIAAECWDGIPDHGLYGEMLRAAANPQELLDRIAAPGFLKQDQWQVQTQAQIQLKAEVFVYSDFLTEQQIRSALFTPCQNLQETIAGLRARYGPEARLCIMPEGPQTIPYLA